MAEGRAVLVSTSIASGAAGSRGEVEGGVELGEKWGVEAEGE